jgi:hypothetical protein
LDLVSNANRAKVARNSQRIDFEDVREVARPAYEAKVKDISDRSMNINRQVFHKIVYPNRSYAEFLLSGDLARLPEVSELWVERLWHLSPQRYVDHETGASYERYRLDYGMYVDLIKSQATTGQAWETAIGVATTSDIATGSVADSVLSGSKEAAEKVSGAWSGFLISDVNQNLLKSMATDRMARGPIGKPTLVEPKKLIADSVVEPLVHSSRKKLSGRITLRMLLPEMTVSAWSLVAGGLPYCDDRSTESAQPGKMAIRYSASKLSIHLPFLL